MRPYCATLPGPGTASLLMSLALTSCSPTARNDATVPDAGSASQTCDESSGAAHDLQPGDTPRPEVARLAAADTVEGDTFGEAIAVWADTVVVGAPRRDDLGRSSGAAYVFTLADGRWSLQAQLHARGGGVRDAFGTSVAIQGDTIVVGGIMLDEGIYGTGAAWVFQRHCGVWEEQQKLLATDGQIGDLFGVAVALEGDTILVGAEGARSPPPASHGAVYVFQRTPSGWVERQKLVPVDVPYTDSFGHVVDISNDTAVIGGPWASPGGAYVFTRQAGGLFALLQVLDHEHAGQDSSVFGYAVAIWGDTLAVADRHPGKGSGEITVFRDNGDGVWTTEQRIKYDPSSAGMFGFSVALGQDTLVAGEPGRGDNAIDVYLRRNGHWTGRRISPSDAAAEGWTGFSVAVWRDLVVAGDTQDDRRGNNSGAAHAWTIFGQACSGAEECADGRCVDGVCCSSVCGGGASDDCAACSVVANGTLDGECLPVVCPVPDSCFTPAVCDASSGGCGTAQPKAEGDSCDDGDPCTSADRCAAGVCAGVATTCGGAKDICHEVETCDTATGQCVSPPKPDGSECPAGVCHDGICGPA